jgi:hypothetical protein
MNNKTKSLFFILLLGIVSIAFVGVKKKSDISTPGTRPATDTVHINPLSQKEYKIKVGQAISYSFREHASVGLSGDYYLSDKSVLVFKERKKVYKNPQKSKMPGGDDSTVTFEFIGGQKGNCDLTLREVFRGKVEKEFKCKIIVE